MAEVTEIVHLKLQAGSDLYDSSSPASGLWKQALEAVEKQHGYKGNLWSTRVEHPTQFIWLIDWTSVEAHKQFINHEEYKPFIALIAQIFDFSAAPPFFYHVNFTDAAALKRAVSAPVTELVAFSIPADSPASTKSALEDAVLKIGQFCDANDAKGVAVGWSIEEHENPEQKKVSALQVAIGWESVEQHMAARGKEEFPGVVKGVRELACAGREGTGMFHVKLNH